MFEAPSRIGNNEKDMSLIFDTFERWAIGMRKVETNIKLLQTENELLREQVEGLEVAQATATTLSAPEETEDIATEEI